MYVDEAIAALQAVAQDRDDMVRTRPELINRLHALLVSLVPSGLPRALTVEAVSDALRRVRPRDQLATGRAIAAEPVEVRRLG